MTRIAQGTPAKDIVNTLRNAKGYYITNTARDQSQSDFKNRILLHTDLLAAEGREQAGYFSLEGPPSTWISCASRSTPSSS